MSACNGYLCEDSSGCIPRAQLCDGHAECTDGSDESYHPVSNLYGFDVSQCNDGSCFQTSQICDRSTDCADGSDEYNCCSPNQFLCVGRSCISESFVCDGFWDCENGADESHCYRCSGNQFQCETSMETECVDKSRVCDRTHDCSDGSDEVDCLSYHNFKPDNVQYNGSTVGMVVGLALAGMVLVAILICCCVYVQKRRHRGFVSQSRDIRMRARALQVANANAVTSQNHPTIHVPITIHHHYDNRGYVLDEPPSYQDFVRHSADFSVPERARCESDQPPSYEDYRKSLTPASIPYLVSYTARTDSADIGAQATHQPVPISSAPNQIGPHIQQPDQIHTESNQFCPQMIQQLDQTHTEPNQFESEQTLSHDSQNQIPTQRVENAQLQNLENEIAPYESQQEQGHNMQDPVSNRLANPEVDNLSITEQNQREQRSGGARGPEEYRGAGLHVEPVQLEREFVGNSDQYSRGLSDIPSYFENDHESGTRTVCGSEPVSDDQFEVQATYEPGHLDRSDANRLRDEMCTQDPGSSNACYTADMHATAAGRARHTQSTPRYTDALFWRQSSISQDTYVTYI